MLFRLVTAEFRRFCTAPRLERNLSTLEIAASRAANGSAVLVTELSSTAVVEVVTVAVSTVGGVAAESPLEKATVAF